MCGETRFDMGLTEEGIYAEQYILKFFRDRNIPCFQPDCVSYENDKYILNEVKNQECFKSPPFDGHGLPKWQVEARIEFFNKTGIRCRLFVLEKGTNIIYYQWLDELEKGEYIDTKGEHPRRIYNISLFKKYES